MLNIGNIVGSVFCGHPGAAAPLHANVVLMKKNVLDFNDFAATVIDGIDDLLGKCVSLQLVSSTVGDPNNGNRGVVGAAAYLEDSFPALLPGLTAGESKYKASFQWDAAKQGVPGAVIVKNHHDSQFFLKTITIEEFPGHGRIHFVCNSWVYPASKYGYDRIFFANNTYVKANTPKPLLSYREDELYHLRGDHVTGELQEWDRVYNYAYYNDLGNPDKSANLARPILGGSVDYPYPRRGKTARPPAKTDPNAESRLPLLSLDIYVPRDERFGHLKMADFLTYTLKAVAHSVLPSLQAIANQITNEFDTFEDVLRLYEGSLLAPHVPLLDEIRQQIPFDELPKPQVIHADKWAWRTDEEFAREMLAGVNPVIISRLEVFPPVSSLDSSKYGNQNSTITAAHIESNLDGLSVEEALKNNKLFILDHHDAMMLYLNRINATASKIYATRTLLFLNEDSTLKPLAIELSLPNPDGEQLGAISKVYTPAHTGVEGSIWQLAKAYTAVNDYGVHQLISHWLHTHAVMEPFVIATNRQLSAMHPVYKLLAPHYRDTMNINALARQMLINAGGIIEMVVFPGKYAMEISSQIYKSWNFMEQGLPADLVKRGVAVGNPEHPESLQLLIKDYPFAVDGLAIWSSIKNWVAEYCAIYYPDDAAIEADVELQAWWKEAREVGHGDLKDAAWWPKMQTVSELAHTCTTIIWTASALHAAVNFGQYPYGGYLPNRPTLSRQFMPEPGSERYEKLKTNPDKVFLETITSQLQAIMELSVIEVLSTHASDEVYLGQRDTPEWTADQKALDAFGRFNSALSDVESDILRRNTDQGLKNRSGPAKVPYMLQFPTSEHGITAKGIPNSVSI